MNLKILSWNVRGLNDKKKRLLIRNFLRSWRADIVCFQETKLEWVTRGIVRSIWSCPFLDWLYLGSEGVMRETQEDYYLVLFTFASQLYFYVLGPISLLGY